MKWRQTLFPIQTGTDDFRGVCSALHRDLRDTRKRRSLLVESVSKIANNENVRGIGNGQVAIHFDPAAAIRLRVGALGKLPAEGRGRDAAGPEHGLCRQHLTRIPALKRDAASVDV